MSDKGEASWGFKSKSLSNVDRNGGFVGVYILQLQDHFKRKALKDGQCDVFT
jgi:hypothetical protein